ncbi:MAG: protein kinase [Gemmatimonadales bacterium]
MPETLSSELLDLQQAVAGRYSLERELGRGGMGIVYLAREVSLDRPVALKLLPPNLAAVPDLRERFLREARTAAKLSHPNIVPIISVEEIDRFVFFVMAYVQGITLRQLLHDKGPLSPDKALPILREISWALLHAHGHGVIHRDIKPDNILIEEDGGRTLVTDFGIAEVADAMSHRDIGEITGTPEFMSPEQATGQPVDARSDIYSLGIVAFVMLSGRLPFDDSTPQEILSGHIRTTPPKLLDVAPGVPRPLAALVDRCLRKDPAERPQTGEAVAQALSESLEKRRELPIAVRVFMEESKKDSIRRSWPLYVLGTLWLGPPLILSGVPAVQLAAAGIAATVLAYPLAAVGRRVRRVLKTGYEQSDIVRALEADLASRDEELEFLYGKSYVETARRLRGAAYASLGLAGLGVAGMFVVPWLGLPTIALVVGASLMGSAAGKRTERRAKARLKFWRGRIGTWLFKFSGIGLQKPDRAPALTARPTEIAIGTAIENIFASLPKETRAAMSDLPQVVAGLEADAQRMRRWIDELDDLLGYGGQDIAGDAIAADSLAGQRERAADRIRRSRAEAQRRLADTVAALENVRIDLLRLKAGTVQLDSVTTQLGAARDLADQVDRLLEGQQDVKALLGGTTS